MDEEGTLLSLPREIHVWIDQVSWYVKVFESRLICVRMLEGATSVESTEAVQVQLGG